MNRRLGRTLILGILLLCLLSVPIVASVAGGQATDAQGATFSLNESERHENPDEAAEDGDDDAVESWLGGWFGGSLEDSALEISEGEYDTAREFLGDDYDDRLGQFVEVTGDTETGESLNQSKSEFERFIELLEEFEETEAAYEEALEDGDAELAREHARELVRIAEELDGISRSLDELLAEIGEELGVDLTAAQESVSEVTVERQERVEEIASAEFEDTVLTVSPVAEEISFVSPLSTDGQVQTVEGEPIANEEIELVIAEQVVTVETDAEGGFSLTYQPVTLSLATDELTVEYVPAGDTPYRGNETTIDIEVGQVEPALSVTTQAESVQYGDEIALNGTLAVDELAVDDVPLDVSVGEEHVGTVSVSDGTYESTVTLPETVSPGTQPVTVTLPFEEQALAGVSESVSLTVEPTATELSSSAELVEDPTEEDDGVVVVDGTLTTATGVPVADESVEITGTAGTTVVETDADGTFEAELHVGGAGESYEDEFTVAYDGAANLEPSESTVSVTVPAVPGLGPESTGPLSGMLSPLIIGLVVLLVAGVVIGTGWWYRRQGDGEDSSEDTESDEVPPPDDGVAVEQPQVTTSLLEQARDHLAAGEADKAVQTGYTAVRAVLANDVPTDSASTHREFYEAYEEQTNGDERAVVDSLRTITEAYERATYGPVALPEDEATETLATIEQVCD